MEDFFGNKEDPEIEAIRAINAALAQVKDEEARARVLDYILARYRPGGSQVAVTRFLPGPGGALSMMPSNNPPLANDSRQSPLVQIASNPSELDGIARVTENGNLKITARDLRGGSTTDKAVRLAHIAIYAYDKLMGGLPLSSRKGLTPLLKEWRLYTGNTRARLARERGIQRNGDDLSLDSPGRRDAERFIKEILAES